MPASSSSSCAHPSARRPPCGRPPWPCTRAQLLLSQSLLHATAARPVSTTDQAQPLLMKSCGCSAPSVEVMPRRSSSRRAPAAHQRMTSRTLRPTLSTPCVHVGTGSKPPACCTFTAAALGAAFRAALLGCMGLRHGHGRIHCGCSVATLAATGTVAIGVVRAAAVPIAAGHWLGAAAAGSTLSLSRGSSSSSASCLTLHTLGLGR
mmetsp:Transcript_20628/g.52356  ORF Transcript_20628/g.52356 Transcript_20628/m.52356 type:complete len:206 (+) Transcript_20628:1682-2299(+)